MEKEITWQEKSQKYTEVKSQQMAFTQSPSVSNNPKIPTYYLIFAETSHDTRNPMTREITWQEKSHGKKTDGKGEKESEASDSSASCSCCSSCCSVLTSLSAIDQIGQSEEPIAHTVPTGFTGFSISTSTVNAVRCLIVLGFTVRQALGQCVQFGPVHLTDCHD